MGAPLSEGEALFDRACIGCHGVDGSGGRGPSLRRSLQHGNQVSDIRAVLVNGLPGTGMPKFHFSDDELKAIVPYIQSLSQTGPQEAKEHGGDAAAGRRIYEHSNCATCHKIGSQGSAFGPNLSRIGSGRSYEYLKASILKPSSDVPADYQAVTVVTPEGKTVKGLRVNEDTFTIQLRLADQSFASFDKQKLQNVTAETASAMPAYHFSSVELTNLLAYLGTLSGGAPAATRPRLERR
jgi:cytochrome c oxidase cbb3-type subunit III